MSYEESRTAGAVEERSVETGPQPWRAQRSRRLRESRDPLVMAPWRAQSLGAGWRRLERPEAASAGLVA